MYFDVTTRLICNASHALYRVLEVHKAYYNCNVPVIQTELASLDGTERDGALSGVEDGADPGTTSFGNPLSEIAEPNAGTMTSRIKSIETFRFEVENDYEEEI